MSLYGMMRTSTSGMAAQENLLGTVADNIANAKTTGYKRVTGEFATLVVADAGVAYQSGSVDSSLRQHVMQQGTLEYTTSTTDLAIVGDGFFVVKDAGGSSQLTRAGAFAANGNGDLVNAGGDTLLAYPSSGGTGVVANGLNGLVPVNLSSLPLVAEPTTAGRLYMNLASTSPVSTAPLPSANVASSASTSVTSIAVFDQVGTPKILDVYETKTAANTWEITVFDRAAASTGGKFPYSSGPLATTTFVFDPAKGSPVSGSPGSIAIPIPNGSSMQLDLSKTTELPSGFAVIDTHVNGSAPSPVDRVEIDESGKIVAVYKSGARNGIYQIPLATVVSPDNLVKLSGNKFGLTEDAGTLRVGLPNKDGLGRTVSGALEQSTVDVATELTMMIEAQKNYTVNSKVFQTSNELMEVLMNLKR